MRSSLHRRSMSSTRKTSVFILLISLVFILAALLVRKEDLDLIPLFPDFKVGWLSSLYAEDYPFTSTIPHNDNIRLGTESKIPKTHDKEGRLSHTRSRVLNRSGVEEHLTTIQQDWKLVVASFFDTAPIAEFSASRIREHYHANENNVKETCMLVTILDGNVTFSEAYSANRHGRASSVKYMVNKIVKEKGKSIPEATFLVMVTDGHKPRVATFGSARHWKNWKLMMPVPLGNERGVREGWGTSLEGWDDYINRNVLSSHAMYSWKLKKPKAVFRGSLSMQTYKLGSCNEENCERPSSWNEVNRGVLYEETRNRPDLFDVGFTYYKATRGGNETEFQGAPNIVEPMKFVDYQRHKFVLNVGSNQDWAERLRSLMFLDSAVVYHMAETQEFFTPLMRPWVHFIPANLYFGDLVNNIEWAKQNDEFVRQLVRNQNAFADRYISERSMQQYWEVALAQFSALQAEAADTV